MRLNLKFKKYNKMAYGGKYHYKKLSENFQTVVNLSL